MSIVCCEEEFSRECKAHGLDEADILDKYDETLKVILDIDEVLQNMPHEIADNAAAKDRIEVSVSFVSEDSIKQLNLDYRGKNSVTDVLSFPMISTREEFNPEYDVDLGFCDKIMLGDVVICLARASKQAADIGQSLSREVVYLFIHSVLHLLGMDHIDEADKEMMRSFEKKVVKKLYG